MSKWRACEVKNVGVARIGTRRLGNVEKRKGTSGRRARARAQGDDASSGDFITDLVGKMFGRAVLDDPEPAGLKRMTKEEWPDQFLAVREAEARNIPSDAGSRELTLVRRVLTQTQLEKLQLGLAYDANTHGWSAKAFHTQLDGQGAALLVGVTESGVVFGGYNSKGWLGYGEWIDAISAFLYVFEGSKAIKLPKVGGSGMAIIDEMGQGPQWGPDGLKITLESRSARSRLGTYYEKLPDGSASLFGKNIARGEAVGLKELRVYVAIEDTELAKKYKPNVLQFQDGELEKIRKNDDEGRMDGFFGKFFGGKK